jgi:hypothetical protein
MKHVDLRTLCGPVLDQGNPSSSAACAAASVMSGVHRLSKVLNEPGLTWEVRRALLRSYGVNEVVIKALVPKDAPSDY